MMAGYVDLKPHLNARVATYDNHRPAGELNAWGPKGPKYGSAVELTLEAGQIFAVEPSVMERHEARRQRRRARRGPPSPPP